MGADDGRALCIGTVCESWNVVACANFGGTADLDLGQIGNCYCATDFVGRHRVALADAQRFAVADAHPKLSDRSVQRATVEAYPSLSVQRWTSFATSETKLFEVAFCDHLMVSRQNS